MPSKFSYSELAQTHDRLKREAQQYLDSLDVSSSDVTSTISRDEVQETKSNVDAAGDHDHSGVTQTSDSEDSDDDVPEMAFQRNATMDDDDSLVAMAQRLDDASVISYSSFDVCSHYTNEEDDDQSMLALPCSTGNTGIRAKKIFPKEKRFGPGGNNVSNKDRTKYTADQKERRGHKQNRKQEHDDTATTEKFDDFKMPSKPKTEDRKSRSVSRERKKDAAIQIDTKWKSNSVYESKPMPSRRRSVEEIPQTGSKTVDGKKFHTVKKKTAPKVSQWKDKDDSMNTRRHEQKSNDSECTVQIDNKKAKSRGLTEKKKKTKARGRKSKCESDDESMHGVGCNTRIHDNTLNVKSEPKLKKNSKPRTRSNSKSRTSKSESSAVRPRSNCTPPTTKGTKSTTETVSGARSNNESDNEDQSVYDSDCNTEFFYESTEDEWSSSEEDLPIVGTSVMKAVEDLNNKSIGFKVKNILGIRG